MQTRHRTIPIDRTQQGNFGDSGEQFLALFDHDDRAGDTSAACAEKREALILLPLSKN